AQIEHEEMGPERADPQERLVAAAGAFEARAGHEVTERVQDQIDEVVLVVDHQDLRPLALGTESEGGLESTELAGSNPEMTARGPKRLELSRLDPVLHGAHGHLTPARDVTRRQITHSSSKLHDSRQKWTNYSCNRPQMFAKLIFLAD